MPLPPLPKVALREVRELSPPADAGFLRLRRRELVARFGDGPDSEPFVYDHIERRALDAVVVAAHYVQQGTRWVYLRSAMRPPVWQRPLASRPWPEKHSLGGMWELVAGLVEPSECSTEGLLLCAARELQEELGFDVGVERVQPLGPSTFPAPGVIGERHHFFHVEVDPNARAIPTEDGSVLERNAVIVALPLDETLALARAGELEDAKTELGLRRLAELDAP